MKIKSNILIVGLVIFSVSLIVTLNQFFMQNYHEEMANQFNRQQLLLAETIAKDIELSIDRMEAKVVSLSKLLGNEPLRRANLEHIVPDAIPDTEIGITRDIRILDEDGRLIYSSLGLSAEESDRILIESARNLSSTETAIHYGAEENHISLAAPIVDHFDRVKGFLKLDIDIDSMNRKFLKPLQARETGYAWMMDNKGFLLFHPTRSEMVGQNIFKAEASCFTCHKSFEVEKKILREGGAGTHNYIAPMGEDKIMAFSKIDFTPESSWMVCVSIPFSQVTDSITTTIKLHTALILTIFVAAVAVTLFIIVINRKRMRAEVKARREEELKRYASMLEDAVEKRTLELISEKEKLNAIVSALDVGLFLADKDKKIVWYNRTVKEWFGEEAEKVTLEDIYSGEELSSVLSDWMMQEIFHHRLGKREGYFQITSTPLMGPDGRMQLLGLIHDVTEIKNFERQMAHSDKLASLGRLTAGIAHEIGNPLTSVFSFLQILREMEKEDFKKQSLDTVIFHINRVADIVRQLSGLSKLPPVEYKDVFINDIVEFSLGLIQYDRRAKTLSVRKEFEPQVRAVTDGNQLSQVFVNMILNAVDAMPDGGTLTIKTMETDGSVAVTVQDTGTGIPPEDLPRVFDPFYTTKDKGTGLGLSVSYGIIKGLGGDIKVRSELEKGTAFTVTIPVQIKPGF